MRMFQYIKPEEIPMGNTAEKVAEMFKVSVDDMVTFAAQSNLNAAMRKQGMKENSKMRLFL